MQKGGSIELPPVFVGVAICLQDVPAAGPAVVREDGH
jgi:hypothetical protein